mmetsp:Transcript_3695/g.8574  ORF Transcript_3695/g.8574 Transcript_3695/m.8574 type:complete len:216 (+) Transcript_3695:168-815(+)
MEDDASARRFDGLVGRTVVGDGKLLAGGGLPLELGRAGLHRLGDDLDPVGDQIGRVETNAELTNQIDIGGALAEGLDEVARAGLGDSSEVVDELVAGHADAGVLDGNGSGVGIGPDLDLGLDAGGGSVVGDAEEALLIAGISGVGDQFSQEDVLVGIQTVDDEVHHPSNLGLELERFLLGLGAGLGGGIGHAPKDGTRRVSPGKSSRARADADGR